MSSITQIENSVELGKLFLHALPEYFWRDRSFTSTNRCFFRMFQIFSLKLKKRPLIKILVGLFYTYIGLVLFLTGVNVGFMPAGNYLGQMIASLPYKWIIIPIGMLIGYFIVIAEPAVYVLTKQVEELTDGAIEGGVMKTGLSISVAVSVGLAMLRVLTGLSIYWILVPGYTVALGLTFLVPKNIHRYRVRLRRRGFRTDDDDLPAAVCNGSV